MKKRVKRVKTLLLECIYSSAYLSTAAAVETVSQAAFRQFRLPISIGTLLDLTGLPS